MFYKIEYDISASIFLVILLLSCLNQKRFPTRSSKTCTFLISDTLIFTLLNITTSLTLVKFPERYIMNGTLSMIQAIFTNFFAIFFYIFTHTTTHQSNRISLKFWRFLTWVVSIEMILILSTPFTHFLFIYDADTPYTHSYGYIELYTMSFLFMGAALLEVIKYRKRLSTGRVMVVFIFMLITLIAVILQMIYPTLQLTSLACAISVFSAYISLHSPGSYYDFSTGTLNKIAFKEILFSREQKTTKSAIILKMTKTNKLKDVFGIEGRYHITRQFMNRVKEICETKHVYYLFNDTFVILFDKSGVAEKYGKKLREQTLTSMKIFPSENTENSINYIISARINVINDFAMLLRSEDGQTDYTSDETIALINYIASLRQPHHYTVIDQTVVSEFKERIRLQRIVENAILKESFEVHMQPIFSIKQNAFVGAEALLRLKDSDGSYIPPLSFIPEAETNGDILKISDIMLQKTCDFINETKLFDKGIQTVNINLSMIQCMYDGIIDHISDILFRNHISPTLIRFEITESVAVNDETRFTKLLEEMTERGIEYALDDYGIGYSNTSQILNHPFSEIKFDKSIIDSLASSGENENAIRYLFELAKEKKMISLAEGVETKEVYEQLKKIGCDMIQGFYFAHPMSADEFVKFLEEHN